MPKLRYVEWNTDDADQAIRALSKAATALEDSTRDRKRHADAAGVEWAGPHRQRFDEHIRLAVSRARTLAGEYREWAASIRSYNAKALALNEEREAPRDKRPR